MISASEFRGIIVRVLEYILNLENSLRYFAEILIVILQELMVAVLL